MQRNVGPTLAFSTRVSLRPPIKRSILSVEEDNRFVRLKLKPFAPQITSKQHDYAGQLEKKIFQNYEKTQNIIFPTSSHILNSMFLGLVFKSDFTI